MEIRFLYSEDCPSHSEALERLRKVVDEEHADVRIEVFKVETSDDAESVHFLGSPTIIIDGKDIDPPKNPQYALTCRAYFLENGRISPLPSEGMIRKAIKVAMGKST